MRAILVLVATAVLMSGSAFGASSPKPVTSEYLVSSTAGFLMDEERGVYYSVKFAIRKPLGGLTYATVEFTNPELPGSPFLTLLTVPADATDISAESPRLSVLRNNKRYAVTVRIYKDESRTILLTKHVQELLFFVPRDLGSMIHSRYGIEIR